MTFDIAYELWQLAACTPLYLEKNVSGSVPQGDAMSVEGGAPANPGSQPKFWH